MESDEVFEHALPALDFEDAVSPVLGASPISVRGEEEEAPSHIVDSPQIEGPAVEVFPSGGGPGLVVSVPSSSVALPEMQVEEQLYERSYGH